ncbi:HVA22-like protein j [Actinidia eriantha]|uniref:HVA22-like protein j n=1 Tax=Actinidia eriantha TaxID=165200 RepID=UPI0025864501|nr:HVA22-like protein j [Actinidia eriantha]
MLGEFITRGLVLVLGYAYPAFECFKTVEKNKVGIEELRFWCQYWIIVAVLTVFERIGDIFISWLPMYGEMKLALFIYLWYPKTKGTGYVYETLLRPYVVNREPDIDRNFQELRARTWDLALYYWQNCTNLGQTTFFQIIQYLAAQSGKFSKTNNEEVCFVWVTYLYFPNAYI